jgi:phage recombination protein Bet
MNNVITIESGLRQSIIPTLAQRYGMEANAFEVTLRSIMPKGATWEHFSAFLMVARQYNLNPVLKEIYAFPTRGGGLQPIVGIDGWLNIINSHADFDGMEFKDVLDADGKLLAVTCKIFRKGRSHPTEVTEYMAECRRDDSDPWKKWPARMLRHKATIQCARYAFGLSGIMDEDEYERMESVKPVTTALVAPSPTTPLALAAREALGELDQIDENPPAAEGVEAWVTRLLNAESRATQDEIFETEIEPAREHGGIGMSDYNRLIALLKDE